MKRLKSLRESKNLKQIELAKHFKVSQSTIAMWETGKRDPDSDTIERIADYFHVSIDYLIGRTDFPHEGEVVAAHMSNGKSYEDLPPEAIEKLEEYKQLLILKYGKKKSDKS